MPKLSAKMLESLKKESFHHKWTKEEEEMLKTLAKEGIVSMTTVKRHGLFKDRTITSLQKKFQQIRSSLG